MKLKVNFDPTPTKALAIGILIFLATFCSATMTIFAAGEEPSRIQMYSILLASLSATVTYLLGFLGYEKTEVKE